MGGIVNDINHNDPQALAHSLRDARRHNDLEGVLDACERLLAQGEHVPRVRDALRWGVDALDVEVRPATFHDPQAWLRNQSSRIANLARQLLDPQPRERPPSQYKLYDGTDSIHHPLKPAPTHALRIYVDALMIAKGEVWLGWLVDRTERDGWYLYSSTTSAVFEVWASPEPQFPTVKAYKDGRIECGETMPPVPEVK